MTGLPLLFDGEPRRLRGRVRHYWLASGIGTRMRTVCWQFQWVHVDDVRGTEQGHPVCKHCQRAVDTHARRQAAHAAAGREAGTQ